MAIPPIKDATGRPAIELVGITADGPPSPTLGDGLVLVGCEFGDGLSPASVVAGEWAQTERVPFPISMERWGILAYDSSGNALAIDAVVDVLATDFATNSFASIAGTDKPTLAAASKAESVVLTGWSLDQPVDTMYRFKLVSFTDGSGTLAKIVVGVRGFAT